MKNCAAPTFMVLVMLAAVFAYGLDETDVAKVILTPGTANIITGDTQYFTAKLLNRYGGQVSPKNGDSYWCEVSNGLGTIRNQNADTCIFEASKAGTGAITYFFRQSEFGFDIRGTANVTVTPAKCTIKPLTTMMAATQKKEFWADCTNISGYGSCPSLSWHAYGGAFSNPHNKTSGMPAMDYTASEFVGEYLIYATNGEIGDPGATYCEIKFDVVSGQPSTVIITRSLQSMETGDKHQFAAAAKDINGNAVETAKIIWSVQGEIGNITTDGFFTADKAGRGTVKAEASCPFLAAGCPSASVEVTVYEKPASPVVPETKPAEKKAEPQTPVTQQQIAQQNTGNQAQNAQNAAESMDPLLAIGLGFVAGLVVFGGLFMLIRKKVN